MLGVLRAALPGAAFAQTLPPPISLWSFDEISSAGGVFVDLGPANVPMDIVGTWADLSTASMVQGIGGTSAYTDGSAYATMPAGDPDHDLSALTISFYYQRNSAAAKHILLAAGNGTQAGDFSIEVLANGRLRGYHVGQDAQLRFFESTNGITGTDLQVGTAHRIDLTLGSFGAKIYLDGAPLTNAFILANTNGWNNTRIKYLGIWIDGVAGPADGAFDRFRIWDRQLTGAQIASLEPAQSITLAESPQQQLSVPSLAEWLASDESDPTPTKYVSNQNRGNGSGSSPANAQEVQAALNGASAGQTFLAVCQTPGTIEHWNYPNGLSFPNGSSGNLITLQARNGDGVVINSGGEYAGAGTPNSDFWTQSGLSQADIDKKIWRSVSTFSGGGVSIIGVWVEFNHVHQLLPYGSMDNLRATYGTANTFDNYAGPGVHQDTDGRVYIRMQRPHPGKYSDENKWHNSLWPNNPEAINASGELAYPVSENPNDYAIYITKQFPGNNNAFRPASGAGTGWFKIGPGINSTMFRFFVPAGTQHIRVDRGTHLCWQRISLGSSGNELVDWYCNRARFSDGSKRHLARAEWKFGGPLEGIRSAGFSGLGSAQDLYFKDCSFADWHELGIWSSHTTGLGGNRQIRFRNCAVFNLLDEGFQGRVGGSRVEIGYCYFRNAGLWGQGQSGTEDTEPDPGKWIIHHNVIDARAQANFEWRSSSGPVKVGFTHSPDQNQPQKIYNNTIFWGPDQENEPNVGVQHLEDRNNTATGTAAAHEVFNNIIIRHDVQRYNAEYSNNGTGQNDFAVGQQHVDPDLSNEFWDYNLYYRDVPGPLAHGLLWEVSDGRGVNVQDFADLAAYKASSKFTLSKTGGSLRGTYSPGFENSSTDVKPTLPSLDNFPADRFKYRPGAVSAVTVSTTNSLSGANWWSTPPSWGATYFPWNDGEKTLAPSAWKGALDPNGTMLPVGVQDP